MNKLFLVTHGIVYLSQSSKKSGSADNVDSNPDLKFPKEV